MQAITNHLKRAREIAAEARASFSELDFRRTRLDLALLAVFSASLVLLGGGPYFFVDDISFRAVRVFQNYGSPEGFFNYPTMVIYLHALAYEPVFWLAQLVGAAANRKEFITLFDQGTFVLGALRFSVFLPGQLVTLCFSALGACGAYQTAYLLLRRRAAGWFAGLATATTLLWVIESKQTTTDIPLSALVIYTLLSTLLFTRRRAGLAGWQAVVLGVLAGLTAGAKYTGGVVILAGLAAAFFALPRLYEQPDWLTWLRRAWTMALASFITFLLTNPYVFIDLFNFAQDFTYELRHAREGHPGNTTDQAWLFHLRDNLGSAMGPLLLGLALIGLAALLFSRRRTLTEKLALTVFTGVYYALIASGRLAFLRYMLPLVPVIAVYAALGLAEVYSFVAGRLPRRPALWAGLGAALLAGGALLPNLAQVVWMDYIFGQSDTRADFQAILSDTHLRELGTRVSYQMYTETYFLRLPPAQRVSLASGPEKANLIVLDNMSNDRWLYDPYLVVPTGLKASLAGKRLVQITPFTAPKYQVPFSIENNKGPYPPDLAYRARPGAFIEMYAEPALAAALLASCERQGYVCADLNYDQGYYYRNIK